MKPSRTSQRGSREEKTNWFDINPTLESLTRGTSPEFVIINHIKRVTGHFERFRKEMDRSVLGILSQKEYFKRKNPFKSSQFRLKSGVYF